MSEPIDFYFDFSSPYGYLASEKIDALAEQFGRKVRWHPILLGVVFRTTGAAPLTQNPLKAVYYVNDFSRSARFMGIPYVHPASFPLPTQSAARAYYWLHGRDCAAARRFAHAAFRALFVEGQDISAPELVVDLALSALGDDRMDRAVLASALGAQELKDRLRSECDNAIALGVFGSPFVIADGETFFGADRLPQLERWLATGGF